jgi:putative oxidoreductase
MKTESRNCLNYGTTFLRAMLGLLFIVPGIMKVMNISMPTGMLDAIGFPAAGAFAWILAISELVFGIAVIVGYKVKYAVWPLILILVVAIITVHIPGTDPMKWIDILFHLVAIAGLFLLTKCGPGMWALSDE